MNSVSTRSRPGRPRAVPGHDEQVSPREQILDAAARLFVEHGFAGTSTRMIAEQAGMRQASMYYHFAGKDEIVVELLATSVRPSLEVVRSLPAELSPAAALLAVVTADLDTLSSTAHNIGVLYLLPELQGPGYSTFHSERDELRRAYGRLGVSASSSAGVEAEVDERMLGSLIMQLVEVVIELRRSGTPDATDREAIAAGCLRLCGLGPEQIRAATSDLSSVMAVRRPALG